MEWNAYGAERVQTRVCFQVARDKTCAADRKSLASPRMRGSPYPTLMLPLPLTACRSRQDVRVRTQVARVAPCPRTTHTGPPLPPRDSRDVAQPNLTLSNLAEAYQYEISGAVAERGISSLTLSGSVRNNAAL